MKKIIICLFATLIVSSAWATEYKYQEIDVQAIEQSIPDAQCLQFKVITDTKLYGSVRIGETDDSCAYWYDTHVAVYDRTTGEVDLVPFPVEEFLLNAANNNGEIVGRSVDWSIVTIVSYLIHPDGSAEQIPDPKDTFGTSGYIGFDARAITDSLLIGGNSNNGTLMPHGLIYSPGGTPAFEVVDVFGDDALHTYIDGISEDGNLVLGTVYTKNYDSIPYIVNRNTGTVTEIAHPDQAKPGQPIGITKDGLALLYIFFPPDDPDGYYEVRTYTYDYNTAQFEQILPPVDCSDVIYPQAISNEGEILAFACDKWYILSPPKPTELVLEKIKLKSYKDKAKANVHVTGEFEPPELLVTDGQLVSYTVTITFHGVMLDGSDLILEAIGEATAYDKKNHVEIRRGKNDE